MNYKLSLLIFKWFLIQLKLLSYNIKSNVVKDITSILSILKAQSKKALKIFLELFV